MTAVETRTISTVSSAAMSGTASRGSIAMMIIGRFRETRVRKGPTVGVRLVRYVPPGGPRGVGPPLPLPRTPELANQREQPGPGGVEETRPPGPSRPWTRPRGRKGDTPGALGRATAPKNQGKTTPGHGIINPVPRAGGPLRIPARLLTIEQAADYLGVSTQSVRRLIAGGEIRPVKLTRRILLDHLDLDGLIDRRKEPAIVRWTPSHYGTIVPSRRPS